MKRYLTESSIMRVLVEVAPAEFDTHIKPDVLWALAESALVNPCYRSEHDNLAYDTLFKEWWPTELAVRNFLVAVSMIETEPFFLGLGKNRYLSPAAVNYHNGTFQAIWSE